MSTADNNNITGRNIYAVDQSKYPQSPKFLPTTVSFPAQIMPSPSFVKWNACEMPWTMKEPNTIMSFTAPHQPYRYANTGSATIKRKSVNEPEILTKQLITEEKMAAHLNSLHISSNYSQTNRSDHLNLPSTSSTIQHDNNLIDADMTDTLACDEYVTAARKNLEDKLKMAQRIKLCEEVIKLHTDPLLPEALMNRIEKQCTAIVLWRPPSKLTDFIGTGDQSGDNRTDDEKIDDEIIDIGDGSLSDNNNGDAIDLNNSMDLDL